MMNEKTISILALIGRILLGGVFLYTGIGATVGYESFVGYTATSSVLGAAPNFFAIAAIIIKIVGGAFLVLGVYTRYAAVALAIFTILATLLFHLNFADQSQFLFFTKNVATLGGIFAFWAFGGGKYSLTKRGN